MHSTGCEKSVESFLTRKRRVERIYSIPTPPGKSWNCVCKISRTWKVLENELGPGKSWNLFGNDVDGGHNDADADAKICASAHLYSVFEQFRCYFFAIHVTVMNIHSSMDAAAVILYVLRVGTWIYETESY